MGKLLVLLLIGYAVVLAYLWHQHACMERDIENLRQEILYPGAQIERSLNEPCRLQEPAQCDPVL